MGIIGDTVLKKNIYLVFVITGTLLFVSSIYRSPITVILGFDYWDDLKIIGSYVGTLLTGISLGGFFIDQTKPTNKVMAEVVGRIVQAELKDLTRKVIEEVRKDRSFQRVPNPDPHKSEVQ